MLGKLINAIKDWWTFRNLDKEVDNAFDTWSNTPIDYLQDDKEQKYYAGMLNLKQEIKRRAKDGNLEEVLRQAEDKILELARKESKQETEARKLRESVYIRQGQDIKTEKDKEDMIDTRIAHYYELQTVNQKRKLIRECRKAYKEGNIELHLKLKRELEKYYG